MVMGSIFGDEIVAEERLSLDCYPMLYSLSYEMWYARVRDVRCAVILPKSVIKLEQLLKVMRSIEKNENLPSIVISEDLTVFQCRELSSAGASWYKADDIFSAPFLAASSYRIPRSRTASPLSTGAQRLAVRMLEGAWGGRTASQIAAIAGKSLSSVSNYFREIEAICPDLIGTSGRTRFVNGGHLSKNYLLGLFVPNLSSPCVRRTYYRMPSGVDVPLLDLPVSGVTALSRLTMIADDGCVTYASHAPIGQILARAKKLLPEGIEVSELDSPDVSIEWWSYEPWNIDGSVDLVSLYLDTSELAKQSFDERLGAAADELRGVITGEC